MTEPTGTADGALGYPTTTAEIGFGFGRPNPNSTSGLPHTGVDFSVPVGSPVYAAQSGKVINTYDKGNVSYGKYIRIRGKSGDETLYAHLSQFLVQKGDEVTRGQEIGKSGESGKVTGPHLHFEYFSGIARRKVNPEPYFSGNPILGSTPTVGDVTDIVTKPARWIADKAFGWLDDLLGWISDQALRVAMMLGGFALIWLGLMRMAKASPMVNQAAMAVATRGASVAASK